MQCADQYQPELPPIEYPAVFAARGCGTIRHQHNAGAKQHGENAQKLLVEENMRREPGAQIQAVGAAHQQGIRIGGKRHGESVDIHHQDAENGNASQDIEADDAICAKHRRSAVVGGDDTPHP